LGALEVKLSAEELKEVRALAEEADAIQGDRYPPDMAKVLYVDTPPLK
jgi:hypothetical protein